MTLLTAFSKSHADADPFFTLTQNALADATYLQYLRDIYAQRIHTPTGEDSQNCFKQCVDDAQRRLKENKLKPGEDVKEVDGKVQVGGQVAVMAINGLLTRIIFDKNPDREFYVEESFPLDWMYPHLEPHGLIMKINRPALTELSDQVLQKDRKYWSGLVGDMIGDWLTVEMPLSSVIEFVEKTHVRGDLNGFKGHPRFIRSDDSKRIFCKLRASIGGVYAWRAGQAADPLEKARLTREAEFAFPQAWVLCPYSPEACFRYVNLLHGENRTSDAILIAETTARQPVMEGEKGGVVRDLIGSLKRHHSSRPQK